MLHILWMIIKFILIVLGVLAGLLLLMLLLLLFCPLRYRVRAKKDGAGLNALCGQAGVSWLFGGISFRLYYESGDTKTSIRILGIPLERLKLPKRKRKQKQPDAAEQREQEPMPEKTEEASGIQEKLPPPPKEKAETSFEPEMLPDDKAFRVPDKEKNGPERTDTGALFDRLSGKLKQILTAPRRLLKGIASAVKAITDKFRNLALTFHNFCDKIDWWKEFVSHPRTKNAISLVWDNIKGLVRHILPTKVRGQVTFGSEDPAVTGSVLAFLGMSIPFHKNCIEVHPLFEGENVLLGSVILCGRIYGWALVRAAVKIYFNKDIKYVINRWKHKEG